MQALDRILTRTVMTVDDELQTVSASHHAPAWLLAHKQSMSMRQRLGHARSCRAAQPASTPTLLLTCTHWPAHTPPHSPHPRQLLVKLLPALVQKLSTQQPKTRAKVWLCVYMQKPGRPRAPACVPPLTPHAGRAAPSRVQLLQLLSHVNKRVKALPAIQLPLLPLVSSRAHGGATACMHALAAPLRAADPMPTRNPPTTTARSSCVCRRTATLWCAALRWCTWSSASAGRPQSSSCRR